MVLAVLIWEATEKETFSALGIKKNANYKIIAIIALLIFQDCYFKEGK